MKFVQTVLIADCFVNLQKLKMSAQHNTLSFDCCLHLEESSLADHVLGSADA